MPDRDYCLRNDPAQPANVRTAFVSHIQRLFQMTGLSSSESQANSGAVMRIETALAKAQLSRVEMRDVNKII